MPPQQRNTPTIKQESRSMKKYSARKNSIISILTRREALGFMGGAAIVSLFGCLRGQSAPAQSTSSAQAPACVVKPQQTEGPYFVDEKLNRSDIRSDPSNNLVKSGVPLRLIFQVSQVSDRVCTPLSNAIVDVWHCDAEGVYSDVRDRRFSTVGQKFLRGYQTTDADGKAEFVTIYPGWYPGRTVHIHFKIRTPQQNYEFTSQLYFDDDLSDRVYTQAPYKSRGERNQRNDQDGIFQNGGDQLLLQMSETETGYVGTLDIGLET
jgi:protocatechuate 3,4-dioxygenase beta subunit